MYMKLADLTPWSEYKLLIALLEAKAMDAGRQRRGSYAQKDLQHECREIRARLIRVGETLLG